MKSKLATNNKTFSLTKEAALADRKWRVVDAENIPLGILASHVAQLIRGKHKVTFTPHVDCGDYVVVVNASKVRLAGRKATDKIYYRHSGYVGGLREDTAGSLRQNDPHRLIEMAVKGMLPKGALGHQMIKKLKVSPGAEHMFSAQSPVAYEIKM